MTTNISIISPGQAPLNLLTSEDHHADCESLLRHCGGGHIAEPDTGHTRQRVIQ